MKPGWFGLCMTGCLIVMPAQAAEVSVAVAANFRAPMQQIVAAFEAQSGHKAVSAFGSTGKLYTQIVNGAPFQVLLAADQLTPERLEREGRAVAGSRFTYAVGRLVLWSRQAGLVDDRGQVLKDGHFAHIALADPKLAPYGAAALQVLQGLGLGAALAPKFVQGESITQAWQYVATGNAELGFVALSQVLASGESKQGSAWIVPAHLYTPIRQDAVLLAAGRSNPAAQALLQFLRTEQAQAIIRGFGYAP